VGPDSGIDCWGLDLRSLVGLLCGAFSVDEMLFLALLSHIVVNRLVSCFLVFKPIRGFGGYW